MNSEAILTLLDEVEARVTPPSPSVLPSDWRERYRVIYPGHFPYPFSEPHLELGAWADDITAESSPRPFIAIWPRGRGKSTFGEAITTDLGGRGDRLYAWYVCGTQEQADKHVLSIRLMIESGAVAAAYPDLGKPMLTKTGGQAWRRNLLVASNGYSVEAVGMDKAVRGGKIEHQRPDLIIFDDIDEKHDTENAVKKKEETITTSILPAGAPNCAVLFLQNLIHDDSIAHRLSKIPGQPGAADYLADRIISGPHPAVDGLAYEFRQEGDRLRWIVTGGVSLWAGFGLDVVGAEINREGPSAFDVESQHAIDADNPLALLSSEVLAATRVSSAPDLTQVAVAVDPSGGAGQCGIIAGGKAKVGNEWHGFTIADTSTPVGTESAAWAEAVLKLYQAVGADVVVVEKNFGGDMAANTIRQTRIDGLNGAHVAIVEVSASRGKEVRAQPIAAAFQQGRAHHVGHFPALEAQWTRWEPGTKPSPDRLDAEVWLHTYLGIPSTTWESIAGLGSVEEFTSRWK